MKFVADGAFTLFGVSGIEFDGDGGSHDEYGSGAETSFELMSATAKDFSAALTIGRREDESGELSKRKRKRG